jgi:phosphoribosylcarboxyaminoimidazole (NCAIR) mutase
VSSELSVAQILANLEAQMALHKEREAYHAEQEVYHREQRAVHAAEHETVAKHYEAFKATAGGAAEIAARVAASAPAPPPQKEETRQPALPAGRSLPSRLVARLIAELPADETFTASRIAAEVNRRFRRELPKPIDSRLASTALRRLLAEGEIRLVEKGTAHREALYSRG